MRVILSDYTRHYQIENIKYKHVNIIQSVL